MTGRGVGVWTWCGCVDAVWVCGRGAPTRCVDIKQLAYDESFCIFACPSHSPPTQHLAEKRLQAPWAMSEVKCLMQQLLSGVAYMHDQWVVHRDLKTSNLLYNRCAHTYAHTHCTLDCTKNTTVHPQHGGAQDL